MKFQAIVLVLGVCGLASLAGCVTGGGGRMYKIDPVPEGDARLETGTKGPLLISEKANMVVMIEPQSTIWTSSERPQFNIKVANLSDYGFKFGVDNIRVQFNGELLKSIRPEVLVVEAKQKQKQAENAAGWFGFVKTIARQASVWRDVTRSEADILDIDNQLQVIEVMDETMDEIGRDIEATSEIARRQTDLALDEYREVMLREQFVPAFGLKGKAPYGGGYLMVESPESAGSAGYFEVLIDVEGEYHDFRFEANLINP